MEKSGRTIEPGAVLAALETTGAGSSTTIEEKLVILIAQQGHVAQFTSHTPFAGQQSLASWQTPSWVTRIVST